MEVLVTRFFLGLPIKLKWNNKRTYLRSNPSDKDQSWRVKDRCNSHWIIQETCSIIPSWSPTVLRALGALRGQQIRGSSCRNHSAPQTPQHTPQEGHCLKRMAGQPQDTPNVKHWSSPYNWEKGMKKHNDVCAHISVLQSLGEAKSTRAHLGHRLALAFYDEADSHRFPCSWHSWAPFYLYHLGNYYELNFKTYSKVAFMASYYK